MCTTCNNHTHEEYNVDYISQEEALDIQAEDIPCRHEQNVYVIDGEYDENECNCNKCSKCSEPKKVSCRSLACQQLNDECSCKRKKIRKTTMVNVLENNVIRLEDKMNSGCASMHENIEDLENNINTVYNELKDEEARAKQQEAFLHYGLDDAVTRAWYNPEDRKIHFYHKNPSNCLNVNVHEGCDCDCCNACGCECKCNNDECQSDIPYTMDDDCNIIPMSRMEEELPFFIDCTDFLKDIFVSEAYIRDDEQDNPDKKHGPILVIKFKRTLEPEPTDYDDPGIEVEVDLSKIWKLENYYDKEQIDALLQEIYDYINSKVSELSQQIQNVDDRVTNEVNNLNNTINNTKTELLEIINNIDTNVDVSNLDVVVPLGSSTPTAFAKVKGQDIKIKIAAPDKVEFDVDVDNKNATLNPGSNNIVLATVDGDPITVNVPQSASVSVNNNNATLTPGSNNLQIASIDNTPITVNVPAASPSGNQVTIQNATLSWGTQVEYGTINGSKVYLTLPQKPETGQGADGNDYVNSGTINNNGDLVLTRTDGGTVTIDLPKFVTNISQEDNVVTFEWSDNSTPTTINVGGACVWKEEGDHVIPVNVNTKVYGAGFYDTTVS